MSTKALTYTGLDRLIRDVKNNVGLLDMPKGEILHLSAGGCTTASIAKAGGVVDISGNGNHGQAYNGVQVIKDNVMGDCIRLDGTDDLIELSSTNIPDTFTELTCSCWVNEKELKAGSYVYTLSGVVSHHYTSGSGEYYMVYIGPNKSLSYNLSTITTNQWHLVTVTYVGGSYIKIFVDGDFVVQSTYDIPASVTRNGNSHRIGYNSYYYNQYYHGDICDLRLYPYALTPTQVKSLYVLSKQPPALLSTNRIIEPTDRTSAQINTLVSQVFA